MAINTYFKNIADAIRTKTGGSGLITPANMPDEILNIPVGGVLPVEPLHINVNNGYIAGQVFYYGPNNTYNSSIYEVNNKNIIIIIDYKTLTSSSRFRYVGFSSDPYYFTSNQNGIFSGEVSPITETKTVKMIKVSNVPYLFIYSGVNAENVDIRVYDVENL